jgi:hypothetical protein
MHLRAALASATFAASFTAMAQHHPTPEDALSEHVAAYKARDVERFLSSVDFVREAEEQLLKVAGTEQPPTEVQIQGKADALVKELREHFAKFGFRAATLDNCKTVTKFQDSDSQVRIILSCSDSRGSTTFPVRVLRFKQGWRIVRGG